MDVRTALERVPALQVEDYDATLGQAKVKIGNSRIRLRFLAERAPDPRGLQSKLRRFARTVPSQEIPILFAPYLRPGLRRQTEKAGVGWLDDYGNCHIESGPVLVHVENRLPHGSLLKPGPRPFSHSGERVLRVLLQDHSRPYKLSPLAEEAKVHESSVSRSLKAFVAAGYVKRILGGWQVSEPGALLDAWIDHLRRKPRPQEFWYYGRPESPQALASALHRVAQENRIQLLFSGLFAAEMIEPLVPAQVAEGYMHPLRLSVLGDSMHLVESPPQEANVRILHSQDADVFVASGNNELEHLPTVGRAQLLADLYLLDSRELPERRYGESSEFLDDPRSAQVAEALRLRWGMQ